MYLIDVLYTKELRGVPMENDIKHLILDRKDETIAYPTLNQMKSALFIQPHPDDNEIGAGGTIALLRRNGVKVYGLTVTKGEGGSSDPSITPEKIAEIRSAESAKAMEILDIIDLGNLGYSELSSINHDQLVKKIVTILREIKVDAVFTVDPQLKNELHPTHIQVGHAVSEAFMRCGVLHFPIGGDVIQTNAYSLKMIGYYMTNDATTIVNISDVMDKKVAAIKAHKSQIDDELLGAICGSAEVNAKGFDFKYAEPLKLCGEIHTHCFAVPADILKIKTVTIYP